MSIQELPLFAYARQCDPTTSHRSAVDTKLVVTGLRLVFVHQIREHGPCTANEAVESFENNHYAQSVRKRASECKALGLVRVVGARACTVTGNRQGFMRWLNDFHIT
jgi:phosphoribosylpyrophosphate synthetase